MSLAYGTGIFFIIAGAALQQFAIYRRTISSISRKCNDSKATLLLYYSTGVSCEIVGLFLVTFYTYLLTCKKYIATFHILFFTYYNYKTPPTIIYKIASGVLLSAFGYFLYRMSLFVTTTQPETADIHSKSEYMFLGIIASLMCCYFSRFVRNKIAKIIMCSGFGTVISLGLKELSIMVNGTLDGVYPSITDIIMVFGVLIIASFIQCGMTKLLLEKYRQHMVFAGYYMFNTLASFIAAQIIFAEAMYEFKVSFISIGLAVCGALMICSDEYAERGKLIQEI